MSSERPQVLAAEEDKTNSSQSFENHRPANEQSDQTRDSKEKHMKLMKQQKWHENQRVPKQENQTKPTFRKKLV